MSLSLEPDVYEDEFCSKEMPIIEEWYDIDKIKTPGTIDKIRFVLKHSDSISFYECYFLRLNFDNVRLEIDFCFLLTVKNSKYINIHTDGNQLFVEINTIFFGYDYISFNTISPSHNWFVHNVSFHYVDKLYDFDCKNKKYYYGSTCTTHFQLYDFMLGLVIFTFNDNIVECYKNNEQLEVKKINIKKISCFDTSNVNVYTVKLNNIDDFVDVYANNIEIDTSILQNYTNGQLVINCDGTIVTSLIGFK